MTTVLGVPCFDPENGQSLKIPAQPPVQVHVSTTLLHHRADDTLHATRGGDGGEDGAAGRVHGKRRREVGTASGGGEAGEVDDDVSDVSDASDASDASDLEAAAAATAASRLPPHDAHEWGVRTAPQRRARAAAQLAAKAQPTAPPPLHVDGFLLLRTDVATATAAAAAASKRDVPTGRAFDGDGTVRGGMSDVAVVAAAVPETAAPRLQLLNEAELLSALGLRAHVLRCRLELHSRFHSLEELHSELHSYIRSLDVDEGGGGVPCAPAELHWESAAEGKPPTVRIRSLRVRACTEGVGVPAMAPLTVSCEWCNGEEALVGAILPLLE